MISRTTTRAAVLVGTLFCLVMGGFAAVVPPASAEGEVTVVWPEITAFNPDTTDYVAVVEWDGTGSLYLWAHADDRRQSWFEEIPSGGPFPIHFPEDSVGGRWTLEVQRCPGEVYEYSACAVVDSVAGIDAWRGLGVEVGPPSDGSMWGPAKPFDLKLSPALPEVDVSWQLLDQGVVVAEGAAVDAPGSGPLPPLGPQAHLVESRAYELRVELSGESQTYGRLVGEDSLSFRWDSVNGAHAEVGLWSDRSGFAPGDTFYPVKDSYGDRLWVKAEFDPNWSGSFADGTLTMSVRNAGDDLVFRKDERVYFPDVEMEWSGLDSSKQPLPEGVYDVEVRMADPAGNAVVEHYPVTLSHDRLVRTTWRRTVTVDGSLVGVERDGCARLVRPAREAWAGSVGYYTRNRCRRFTAVETTNRLRVPDAVTGEYDGLRVGVVGGKARGERDSLLGVAYGQAYEREFAAGGRVGTYFGHWASGDGVDEVYGKPGRYVTWWAIARDGSSYDVKRFIVEVRYEVLR